MKYTEFEYLNKLVGKHIYLLCSPSDFVITTTKKELDDYLAELDEYDMEDLMSLSFSNDMSIIYGLVLDIKELPYEISPKLQQEDFTVFLVTSSPIEMPESESVAEIIPYESIAEVSDEIENMVELDESIDNLAVIVGKPIKLKLAVKEAIRQIQPDELYET